MGLDTVELVMEFEDEFDIEIPNDAAAGMTTLRIVRDFVLAEYQRLGRSSDPEDIFRRIRALTASRSGVDPDRIGLDTAFVDDLGLD